MNNLEAGEACRWADAGVDGVNFCQGWGVCFQGAGEKIQHGRRAIHLYFDSGRSIAHPTDQAKAGSQAVNERPETNPLDDTLDMDVRAR